MKRDRDYSSEDEAPPKKFSTPENIQRRDCPYISQIDRNLLDFDFRKECSETLSRQHVYVDLVDGQYFRGRTETTPAYRHALEKGHYIWMRLSDGRFFCIPDGYEVLDASLDDIKYNRNPTYHEKDLDSLDQGLICRSLDGAEYFPGCVGLNDIKNSDYQNVVIQLICRIKPLRNYLLLLGTSTDIRSDALIETLSELIRKIYNKLNFKGVVSPHEFYQAVGSASKKRFYGGQMDPLEFFDWVLNYLTQYLVKKKQKNLINSILRGQILDGERNISFQYLELTLPNDPVFQVEERHTELTTLLSQKFRTQRLLHLPPYLLIRIQRFVKNNFFWEKKDMVVEFPMKDLDMTEYCSDLCKAPCRRYNLVGTICHEGKHNEGTYRSMVHLPCFGNWYECENLSIKKILPQSVAVTETYVMLWKRQDLE